MELYNLDVSIRITHDIQNNYIIGIVRLCDHKLVLEYEQYLHNLQYGNMREQCHWLRLPVPQLEVRVESES